MRIILIYGASLFMIILTALANAEEQKDLAAGNERKVAGKIELTPESFDLYLQLSLQAWGYGGELIRMAENIDEGMVLFVRQNLAAASFRYYISITEGIMLPDKELERIMRLIMKEQGVTKVWNDPLNWFGEGLRRGIGLEGWSLNVSDGEYKAHVRKYQNYFYPDQ
jgi:hypothetical protein